MRVVSHRSIWIPVIALILFSCGGSESSNNQTLSTNVKYITAVDENIPYVTKTPEIVHEIVDMAAPEKLLFNQYDNKIYIKDNKLNKKEDCNEL